MTLRGIVEIDEVYIRGTEWQEHDSRRIKADRGTVGKAAVVRAKERASNVASKPVPATDAVTLGGFVEETVEPSSPVSTEESGSYGKLWE